MSSRNKKEIYSNKFSLTAEPQSKLPSDAAMAAVAGNAVKTTKAAFAAVTTAVVGRSGMIATITKYAFFLSIAVFVLFLLLLGLHYFVTPVFSFGGEDDGYLAIPSVSNKQIAFENAVATYSQSANFNGLYPYNTTFAMNVKLIGDFTSPVPRVFWYRALAPVTLDAADTEATLASKFTGSNVVLFMDALKNDLKVLVLTSTGSKIETAIENVPIGKPFRLQVVINKTFVEIYMNGQLYKTIQANSELLLVSPDANVYGPPQRVGAFVKLANVTYWPYLISPKLLRVDAANNPIREEVFV